ncbi:hypothetical protein T484DRAFT_1799034 [Baffinella frigidus]|nr:hypothetical protein T484DRAFT_1799034 [Cryptophyta sp. CCMP2293]
MQRRATATAGAFKPQDVANLLWALATMGEVVDGLLVVLIDRWAARELGKECLPTFSDGATHESRLQWEGPSWGYLTPDEDTL